MHISYLITCSNEEESLKNLLYRVRDNIDTEDEMVVILDSERVDNKKTKQILKTFGGSDDWYHLHPLSNNYSEHKNWGAQQCQYEWIFQLDGDELPTETLVINIKDIITLNPDIEAFWIPRINDFRGVTEQHAMQWGWRLSMSPTYKRPIVNWHDPQCRLFMNKPEIKWVGRLHERIQGNKTFVYLPADEDLAIYHDKTIEKQVETNLKYNKLFTEKENQGFKLPTG